MERITKISLTLLLFMGIFNSQAQVQLGRQVIGSTGGYGSGTNFTISSTVGEAVVQTLFSTNNILILTQGFHQPLRLNDSLVEYEVINESCPGAANGSIYIDSLLYCPRPYTIIIKSVNDTTKQLGADTLKTGDYLVVIIGSNGSPNPCTHNLIIHVGLDSDEDCTLKFYTGITPNGDNKNDLWIIENIEMFPENTVQIFNRWGQEVWYGKNYDNDEVAWHGNNGNNDEGERLADATYFYVAVVEGKTYKGWVELTR